MASKSRNQDPESPWTKFKKQCAEDVGQLQYCHEFKDSYKGDLPSKVNGAHGGPIGGQMVKKMIEYAERNQGL
jgi:small acid-soluble spore protein D (minor alpha/beta-type SASP)